MPFPRREHMSHGPTVDVRPRSLTHRKYSIYLFILVFFMMSAFTTVASSQSEYNEEDFTEMRPEGLDQIDRIEQSLQRAGKICLKVGVVLLILAALKKLNPLQLYYSAGDRVLKKAVRDVDDLLKRIHAEAEANQEESPKESTDGGVLAGMTEVAELSEAEEVPGYVLTVNDVMLDNVRMTLKRLRRFNDAGAERYKQYMFSVVRGIQIVTEACLETGVASNLAVDIHAYFKDDHRYLIWQRTVGKYAKRGAFQEPAQAFLRFMKNVKEGKSAQAPTATTPLTVKKSMTPKPAGPRIPEMIDETTLPVIQQAAKQEAVHLHSLIQANRPLDDAKAWQFELVRRQQQLYQRNEAQRVLQVFLSSERKVLHNITRSKMLPCRTWDQILYMLGVNSTTRLQQRIDEKLLTEQEIGIIEKAFLQTFAKTASLKRIYGLNKAGQMMMDLHVPQIRRETLILLRKCVQTELHRLDSSTETLDDEETPEHHEVTRLIKHYVYEMHDPPGVEG